MAESDGQVPIGPFDMFNLLHLIYVVHFMAVAVNQTFLWLMVSDTVIDVWFGKWGMVSMVYQ